MEKKTITAIGLTKTSSAAQSTFTKSFEQKIQNLRKHYPSLEAFNQEFSPAAQAAMARFERHAIMEDYSTLETLNFAFGTNAASSWQGVNEKTAEKQK